VQVLDEPLYNSLRTQQQLGYSVGSSPTNTAGVLGFLVTVTSDHAPAFVEHAIEHFLSDAVKTLEDLTEEQFQEHVKSLVTLRLEPYKNIAEQVEEHWGSVWSTTYDFYDRYQVLLFPMLCVYFRRKRRQQLLAPAGSNFGALLHSHHVAPCLLWVYFAMVQ
jgi:secreted Zn-dependent insulinase-like peptidase